MVKEAFLPRFSTTEESLGTILSYHPHLRRLFTLTLFITIRFKAQRIQSIPTHNTLPQLGLSMHSPSIAEFLRCPGTRRNHMTGDCFVALRVATASLPQFRSHFSLAFTFHLRSQISCSALASQHTSGRKVLHSLTRAVTPTPHSLLPQSVFVLSSALASQQSQS